MADAWKEWISLGSAIASILSFILGVLTSGPFWTRRARRQMQRQAQRIDSRGASQSQEQSSD